ncbi:hypothetical protein FKP32DRAFT_1589850 [Trametes sanguinea]|nr:hypothetical protein FKP32DRAFT_1589850 [Trametes sanguinea]
MATHLAFLCSLLVWAAFCVGHSSGYGNEGSSECVACEQYTTAALNYHRRPARTVRIARAAPASASPTQSSR